MSSAGGGLLKVVWIFYLSLIPVAVISCKSNSEKLDSSTEEKVISTTVVREGSKTQLVSERKRPDVLVGGCDANCADYKAAFSNYLMAASRGEDGVHTIPYLETSEMVYNHNRLGDGWVELWRGDDLGKRQLEIAGFAKKAHGWVNQVSSDALVVSFQNSITYSEDDGPGFLAYYKPPEEALIEGEMREWRYRIQKRGWEWLIS